MTRHGRGTIVLLGMMTRIPVAGVVWQTAQYIVGFRRLGYDVYYVEQHGRMPSMFMEHRDDDGAIKAARFLAEHMRRFDMTDRWSYQTLQDGRGWGISPSALKRLYASAAMVVNLHGGTKPLPEHAATDRFVYLETDPVQVEVELYHGRAETTEFLDPHSAFFTYGENLGNTDCRVPVPERYTFLPTRQPIVMDFWDSDGATPGPAFTTVGNWRQNWGSVEIDGETYHWSKHFEFLKFLDLPHQTDQAFELALGSYHESDVRHLERHGWRVRPAQDISNDPDAYREYILTSRGEFTVAKDQNVRLRSGWFSDRSASYLAAGRPVINQETGFSNVLPTGHGLFTFTTMEEVLEAVDRINADYAYHSRAARNVAREYFSYDVVLAALLQDVGLPHTSARSVSRLPQSSRQPFPPGMDLTTRSRWPTVLAEDTERIALANRSIDAAPPCDVVWASPVPEERFDGWLNFVGQLARLGYRVWYAGRAAGSPSGRPVIREIRPGVCEIAGWGDASCGLFDILSRVRDEHAISTAVLVTDSVGAADILFRAKERWGWKILYQQRNATATGADDGLVGAADFVTGPQTNQPSAIASPAWEPQRQAVDGALQGADRLIRSLFPRVSLVIATHNGLAYTKLCLESVLANTDYPNYEIIVVDNASTDGTVDYLPALAGRHPQVRPVFESENLGFARANNEGLNAATGDIVVLLNNDTLVPRGWLTRLIRHLEDDTVGMVGPVTNRAANEAQVDVSYRTYEEFANEAFERSRARERERFEIPVPIMFCAAMRREIYERVGPLDEQFEIGMFEDDDYAVRLANAGYRTVCAEDVLIHHFGQATIGNLAGQGVWGEMLERNRGRFERKWGVSWEGHSGRHDPIYRDEVARVQRILQTAVPTGATVAVVSKGDGMLLPGPDRVGWHFPRDTHGEYAGFYPADDEDAIARLEEAKGMGAEYFVLPRSSMWWLDYYSGFRRHLEHHYPVVVNQHDACILFSLAFTDQSRSSTDAGEGALTSMSQRLFRCPDSRDRG